MTTLPTLTQAWQTFMRERSAVLEPTTLATDWNQAAQWLKRCPIQDLDHGREILSWVYSQHPRPAAIRVGMFTRALYRWLCSDGVELLDKDPTRSIKTPKRPQKAHTGVRVLGRNESAALIQALRPRRSCDTPWHLLYEFLEATGLRTGEAFSLRFDDITDGVAFIHSNWTLTHGYKASTKTNQPRYVPLNRRAMEIVEERRLAGGERLFPWCRESFQSIVHRRVEELVAAGVLKERCRIYDARHTAISRWIEAGIPLAQAGQWAGNSNAVILKNYLGVSQVWTMPESDTENPPDGGVDTLAQG